MSVSKRWEPSDTGIDALQNDWMYKSLFAHNPDGVFRTDEGGYLQEINAAGAALVGYVPGDLLGHLFLAFVAPDEVDACRELFVTVLQGQPVTTEFSILHRGGHMIRIMVSAMPIVRNEVVTGVYGIAKDVTWRRQLEDSLRDTTRLLHTVIDVAPVAIYTLDAAQHISLWSKGAEEMFGWTAAEIIGKPNLTLQESGATSLYHLLMSGQRARGEEVCRRRKDGSAIDVAIWGASLQDDAGAPVGVMAIATDVSEQKRVRELLTQSQQRMREILTAFDIVLWSYDLEKRIVSLSSTGRWELDDQNHVVNLSLRQMKSVIHPDDQALFQETLDQAAQGLPIEVEYRMLRDTQEVRWVRSSGRPMVDERGQIKRYDGVTLDITERKLHETAHSESQARYLSLLNLIPDAIVVHRNGQVRYVNRGFLAMMRYESEQEINGMPVMQFIHPDSRAMAMERNGQLTREGLQGDILPALEHRIVRSDGMELYTEITSLVIRDEGELSILSVLKDISERKRTEMELRYMAYHDALTGLPNRRLFTERLKHLTDGATDSYGARHAVMFLDMDRFKLINDSYGHEFGDSVLQETAQRLSHCVPSGCLLARIGGDEFAILIPNLVDERDAVRVARSVIREFERAMRVGSQEFYMTPSIGISTYPVDGTTSDALLKKADVAMYAAKVKGGNQSAFSAGDEANGLADRVSMETRMRHALQRQEFVLHYQPKISAKTGVMCAAEALVRWHSPEEGLIYPGRFIGVAEESGLIVPLGEWVLTEACRQNREWQKMGYARIPVSVNVSAKQFQAQDMVTIIERVLCQTELAPQYLAIEITESLLIQDSPEIAKALLQIRQMGVLIAIDDFGTGYSSLRYLQLFHPTHLKIDQSFIGDMLYDRGQRAIVTALIHLAHNLGMAVVAEGVETKEQYDLLVDEGCDLIQGYYFSKPIPESEFIRKLPRT